MFNFLRKGVLAALVIGLIVGVVGLSNAYNIRQNPDGTTDWVDPDANRAGIGGTPEIRVGRQYITLPLTNITTAMTHFVVSPISGVLYGAFAVQTSNPVLSMTSTLTFGVMQPISAGNFVHPTTAGWIYIVPTQAQGTVFYNRPGTSGQINSTPGGRTPSGVTRMQGQPGLRQGGIISIAVGGEAPDVAGHPANQYDIIIIIDPR